MSYFFCESYNHLSQNCDIHVTDVKRQIVAEEKNYCGICLTNLSTTFHYAWSTCQNNQKCYICFSNKHHTFFCHEKNLLASSIFIPNIDEDLLPRFMKTVDLEEQISLILSSPKATTFAKIQPLIVIAKNNIHANYRNTNLLLTDTLSLTGSSSFNIRASLPSLESIIFKGDSIYLNSMEHFCSQKFLQFLSPRLKFLHCNNVELTKNITFSHMLQSAPNLEVIDLNGINIHVNNSWPEEIFMWKKGFNLKNLTITLKDFSFNVSNLVSVMKDKSKNDVKIILNLYTGDARSSQTILENAENKLMPYFDQVKRFSSDVRGNVFVSVKNVVNDRYFGTRYFVLKTKVQF